MFLGKTGHAFIHSSTLENTESPRYFTEQPQVSSETTRHKASGARYHDTCFADIDPGLFWLFEPPLPPPDSRSICTMLYILRHAIEKWLKALDLLLNLKLNSTTWTSFFGLPSCCFFICTMTVSNSPHRTFVRLKSQNVHRAPGTMSRTVLAKE